MFKSESKIRTSVFALIGIFTLAAVFELSGQKKVIQPNTNPQKCVSQDSISWLVKVNQLEYIAQKLRGSDLPSRETSLIIDSVIVPLERMIINQVVNLKR